MDDFTVYIGSFLIVIFLLLFAIDPTTFINTTVTIINSGIGMRILITSAFLLFSLLSINFLLKFLKGGI